MDNKENVCYADKGYGRCAILNVKSCENCGFKKTHEQYRAKRLKYCDKEKAFLEKHGIVYRDKF